MKALVTGGSGFIGSHVVDKLRDKGIEVRIYDMVLPTHRHDIEYYQGSLLDLDAMRMALSGVDVVFHLAAIADVKDVFEDPHYSEAINVRGTANVMEAVRRSSSVNRVIYASTIWVYSDCAEEHVTEATPLAAPSHLYSATKLAGEYYCFSYSQLYGLETTILRYGIPYGPRARGGAVVPIFVNKAFKGEALTIAGDGSQSRRFIYVEDLAEGNVLALQSIAKNKIYNLAGKDTVSIKQIAETVQKLVGNVTIESVPARPGDFSGKEVSIDLAKKELGWEPRVNFEEGVRRYIAWHKEEEEKKNSQWDKVDKTFRALL